MDKQAIDIIEAIEKRCRIARILYDAKEMKLIPTVLEDIHFDSQALIDGWCIEEIDE